MRRKRCDQSRPVQSQQLDLTAVNSGVHAVAVVLDLVDPADDVLHRLENASAGMLARGLAGLGSSEPRATKTSTKAA